MAGVKLDGDALRHARVMAGYSTTALAELIGKDHSYISNLEANRRNASPEMLERIVQALKCPKAMLLARPDEQVPA